MTNLYSRESTPGWKFDFEAQLASLTPQQQSRKAEIMRSRRHRQLDNREKIDLEFFEMQFWGMIEDVNDYDVYRTGEFVDISLYCGQA